MLAVKVMTYNIQGHAASRRPDHIPKIAEVISAASPDVVGLQEVHCKTRTSVVDQAEQLAALTGLHLAFGRSCSMEGGDYGNAVLARHPIGSSHVCPLPGSGAPPSLLQTSTDVIGSLAVPRRTETPLGVRSAVCTSFYCLEKKGRSKDLTP